jgi:hypothetical protein
VSLTGEIVLADGLVDDRCAAGRVELAVRERQTIAASGVDSARQQQ